MARKPTPSDPNEPSEPADDWPGANAPDELDELEESEWAASPFRRRSEEEEDRIRRENLAEDEVLEQLAREEWRRFAEDNDPPPAEWHRLAEVLRDARARLGISKREAAKRANLSEGAWRHLEKGVKYVGGARVEPNPRNENLLGVARAVNLNPAAVFFYAGRPLPEGYSASPSPDELVQRLRLLSAEDRQLVDNVIARLLRG